jgi:hypothetical protein
MDTNQTAGYGGPGVQQELFGMVVNAEANFTKLSAPCAICAAGVGAITPGRGPHYAALYCVRGHFQKWLPRGSWERGNCVLFEPRG